MFSYFTAFKETENIDKSSYYDAVMKVQVQFPTWGLA